MSIDRFLPIPVSMLAPATAIGLDLYQIHADAPCPVLFRGAAYPLDLSDLAKLHERGITCLYFSADARGDYHTHLRRLAEGDGGRASGTMAARLGALAEVVRDVLGSAFELDDVDGIVAAAHDLAGLTCNVVCHCEFTASDLFVALHHDAAMATHSTNVALYAAVLAKSLGFAKHDIAGVIRGALLHDLGMLAVSRTILSKPARLNDREMSVVRRHTLDGFRRLADHPDVGFAEAMMVYQHHERMDGRGYPVGLKGAEIHPWARLCTVVDIFDAVTSQRPHRKRLAHPEAIQLLRRVAGTALDSEMVACWAAIIPTASTDSSDPSTGQSGCPTSGATISPNGANAARSPATSVSIND